MRSTSIRRITAVGAVAATALTLSACGSADVQEPTGEVSGSISYSFWGSPTRAEKVNAVIDLFEGANPGTTVETDVADYYAYTERLTVRAAGGGLSCATGSQSMFASRYANEEIFRPLDDLVENGELDLSGFSDDIVEASKIDGQQFIMPSAVFVRIPGYNRALVEESGAAAPSDDFTWDEYADWLRDIQAGLPDGVYASEIEAVNMFSFTSWVVGHGEEMFDGDAIGFDKQLLADWFEYWLELSEEGVTIPAANIADQFGAVELQPMATGLAAVAASDIPQLYLKQTALQGAGFDTEVGWFSVPSEDPEQSGNVIGINGISIPADCDNVSTAAAFADYFSNDVDAALAFQSDNGIAANADAQDALLEDAATSEGVKQSITILRDLVDAGDTATTSYPETLNTLTTELRRAYEDVAFGRSTVDQAVDSFFAAGE